MDYSNQKDKSLFFKVTGKMHQIFADTIIYIECAGSISSIHLLDQNKCIHCCAPLKDIEDRLDGLNFYRINRNTLLNLRYFTKFVSGKKRIIQILNGEELKVSRRSWQELRNMLNQ